MHFCTVAKIIAILLAITSLFMLSSVFVALWYGEYKTMCSFFYPVLIVLLGAGGVLWRMKGKTRESLSIRDGFLFVVFSWLLASMVGALPFYFSGTIPHYADAYFETMSGFTTTGASILTEIESLPRAILYWRSLTHWLGGMGIVVLTVAILPLLGVGGLQLVKAEAPGPTVDKITPRITETAKYLWYIYLGITVAEAVLLMFGGMTLFDALTHTFGTVATGGFSTRNASVGHYDSAYIDLVITFFMLVAGMNFTLHFKLLTGNFRKIFSDTELKAYLFIFAGAVIIMTVELYHRVFSGLFDSFRYAAFQAASILTTTGYATADYEHWPFVTQMVLFTLMFVGGCSGSTGGGVKVIRIVTLLKQGINEMKYLVHPKGVFLLRISGNPVRKNIVYAISGFFFFYIFTVLLVTFIVSTAGIDIVSSLTTALATVGNIGPGFGRIGPTGNYAFYPDYVKWMLSLAMMVGRLEIYTVLVILTPTFWNT
jgi:trk system potassium uptake protein TrkH